MTVLGVAPGAAWTGYVLRRGGVLLGGGTWAYPAGIAHDARTGPVPLPGADTVRDLLAGLDRLLDGFPGAAAVARVAVQVPQLAGRAGRTARGLHAAPPAAFLAGAIAGHYGADRTVLVPPAPRSGPGPLDGLPAELRSATAARAAGITTLGRRGDLTPVRTAWYTSLRVDPGEAARSEAGLPSRPVLPGAGAGRPGVPAETPAAEPPADRATVQAYQRELVAATRAREPRGDEALLRAAADAVVAVARPAGAPTWTAVHVAAWVASGAMTDGLAARDRDRLAAIWTAMEAATAMPAERT